MAVKHEHCKKGTCRRYRQQKMRYMRRVKGLRRLDRKRSDDIRERLRQEDVRDLNES